MHLSHSSMTCKAGGLNMQLIPTPYCLQRRTGVIEKEELVRLAYAFRYAQICSLSSFESCQIHCCFGHDTDWSRLQVDFIEKTIATEKRLRTITWVAVCAVIALVVFAGATFGLTYAVIDMTKEAQPAVRHTTLLSDCHAAVLPAACCSASVCTGTAPSFCS